MTSSRMLILMLIAAAVCMTSAGVGAADEVNVILEGYFGGDIKALTISGNYAYIGQGGYLVVLDISNPISPVELGRVSTGSGERNRVIDIKVSNSYAYIADWYNGLAVVDISNPSMPVLVSCYNIQGGAGGLTVSGNYVYIASGWKGLEVVDVSNPSEPIFSGLYDTGFAYDVKVSGNYAYVADWDNGLVVVDISNPLAPVLASQFDTDGKAHGVTVSGNYAYVADWDNGLVVVDISNPLTPLLAGHYDTAGWARSVTVSNNFAYIADALNGLVVVDISSPMAPVLAGQYKALGYAYAVTVTGNYAYVADGMFFGFVMINISNPMAPTHVLTYKMPGYARNVKVSGSYGYIADRDNGLVVVDVSNPTNPLLAGHLNTLGSAWDVVVLGNYAYIADSHKGLAVVDISNPTNPLSAGRYDTPGDAHGVTVSDNYAYVADGSNGLVVVDISNPMTPVLAGHLNRPGNAHGVTVSGNYAYVADMDFGLLVVDISNPTNPWKAGGYNTPGKASGVTVSGKYAYVADGSNGLVVVDTSNPMAPLLVGHFDTAGWALGITVSGNYAYVADAENGLVVVDINYPNAPSLVGHYNTVGLAQGVTVSGNYAYVADRNNGLVILRMDASSIGQDPIADAGADQTAVSGDIVYFDGSNSYDPDGTIVSYQWDFGDGTTAEGEIVSHRFRGKMNPPKRYTVTLTVKDDSGDTGVDTSHIEVDMLRKDVEVFGTDPMTLLDRRLATVTVLYNWIEYNEENTYILSRIIVDAQGYIGMYNVFLWDSSDILIPSWGKSGNVDGHEFRVYNDLIPVEDSPIQRKTIFVEDEIFVGLEVQDFDAIQVIAQGFPTGIHIGVGGPPIPHYYFEVDTVCFIPDTHTVPDLPTDEPDLTFAHLCSPGELRVYDSQGNVTGLVNGEIKEEIPNSIYNDEIVMIPSSSDSFTYEVKGTDEGSYGLRVATITDKEFINFAATDIPTSANAMHQYAIDWNALSQGGEGVTVQIDADGDGIFEQTIITDNIFRIYNITFLPPITTMEQFNLTDGRTLPIKFTARNSITNEFIYDDTVNVTITNSTCHLIAFFTNGTGTDSVRINSTEEQYIVNFHTKDYDLNVGETYTIHVTFGDADALWGYAITHFTLVDLNH